LNNFRWIKTLLTIGSSPRLLNMFGRKRRRNNGMVWASIIGLLASAAAFGIRRNQGGNMLQPIQNVMNKMGQNNFQNNTPLKTNGAFAEFSKEITPPNDIAKNK
jgi:hypothetical protein